ncbi:TIGR00725 family protein [Caldiplasma sukawensis]
MNDQIYIGVLGGANPTDEYKKIAYEVGKELAQRNAVVICGGLTGVMEEVSRGVYDNHGVVIGILPGYTRENANKYLTYSITTGIGYARNFMIIRAANALIAIDGANGTISEEAFAISEGKDVISLGSHQLKKMKSHEGEFIIANNPRDAVDKAIKSGKKYIENVKNFSFQYES